MGNEAILEHSCSGLTRTRLDKQERVGWELAQDGREDSIGRKKETLIDI